MFFHESSDHRNLSAVTDWPVRICNYGMVSYPDGLAILKSAVENRMKARIPDTLLLFEHPPTYTLGLRGKIEHLLIPQQELKNRKIEIFHVDRGGDITFHGPGQLVGYPVLDLKARKIDIRQYVKKLENVMIQAIADYGIEAHRFKGFPGVWVNRQKIAAIGVKINTAGIASHGFALNVNTDLSFFGNIIPCGLRDMKVTSLAEVSGHPIEMAQMNQSVTAAFLAEFEK